MALYDVYRADGSVTRVEAGSKSEASAKVRKPGEAIKKVVEVTEEEPTPTPETTAPTTPTPTDYLSPDVMRKYEEMSAGMAAASLGRAGTSAEEAYADYQAFIKQEGNENWPVPKDINEFLRNMDYWAANADYYSGITEEPEWTADQIREYNLWRAYASAFGELGEWRPVDIADFYANYDQAQSLLTAFQQRQSQSQAERGEAEAYTQEQREYQEYLRQEAFRETPMYGETFASWMSQQRDMSGAFTGFVESEYPSLRGRFEAAQPREVGYPTREAARAEVERKESAWQAWLPQQVPELWQEYSFQPPAMRGERHYMYQPTMRPVNW